MPRLSIDLSTEEHERIKTLAAFEGKSVNEYILQRSIPPEAKYTAIEELKAFLKPRIAEVENGVFSDLTFEEIKQEAHKTKAHK